MRLLSFFVYYLLLEQQASIVSVSQIPEYGVITAVKLHSRAGIWEFMNPTIVIGMNQTIQNERHG